MRRTSSRDPTAQLSSSETANAYLRGEESERVAPRRMRRCRPSPGSQDCSPET